MGFLLELIFDIFLGAILGFVLLCLKVVFEIVFERFLGEVIRFIGVCFLYTTGKMLDVFKSHKKAYSFDALWTMEYDKGDDYKLMMENTGQRIAGFTVIAVVLVICFV